MTYKRRLVVIGNGMAGARFVEEVLARGGGEQFEIIMFGDEPHGNYNRILLSNVLSGEQSVQDIFLNPLDWYRENGVTLHAGCRVTAIDRHYKRLFHEGGPSRYDELVIATGSSAFVPPFDGLTTASGEPKPGVGVCRAHADGEKITERAGQSR